MIRRKDIRFGILGIRFTIRDYCCFQRHGDGLKYKNWASIGGIANISGRKSMKISVYRFEFSVTILPTLK